MATGQQAYPVPSSTGSSGASGPLFPAFPYVTDFANVARWTIDPRSGLWLLAPNTNADVADVKSNYAQLGGASMANAAALQSASYTGGVLTWTINSSQDWSTSGGTSALIYWPLTTPNIADEDMVIALRVVTPTGLAETAYFGVLIAVEATPTTDYMRFVQGYLGGSHTGYSQTAGTFGAANGNHTLSQANQEAGVWHRFVFLRNNGLIYQTSPVVTDSYDVAAGTGTWTTQRTSSASAFSASTPLRIGLFAGHGATATSISFTARQFTTRTAARDLGRPSMVGFGLPRSRSVTPIPVVAADIGSGTISDAEVIARLARSVNTLPGAAATVRAYIQRGSDYSAPSDGDSGWVTYSGGTFSGLATSGTGAKLSIWLDAASTNGSQTQHASFDPRAFGALTVT